MIVHDGAVGTGITLVRYERSTGSYGEDRVEPGCSMAVPDRQPSVIR